MIIDSHAHYENKRFSPDRHALISSMPSLGIELIINSGCDLPSTLECIALAEEYPFVYATAGVHPHEAKTLTDANLEIIKTHCTHKKVVALGEIGLDFHYDFSPRDVQRHWFKRQLIAATEVDLPVVIHSREADDEVFEIIKASPVRRGVIHSFSGDALLAQKYVDMGFYIGINGVITFDKTGRLAGVVKTIPLDKLLLETDAPYLTPAPYRGKRNQSNYLTHVAEKIAELQEIDVKTVCDQTSKNVRQLYNI